MPGMGRRRRVAHRVASGIHPRERANEPMSQAQLWIGIPDGEAASARITRAVARFGLQADGLRLRLSQTGGRVLAQANALASERNIRVQVSARALGDAVDELVDRLRVRLAEASDRWSAHGRPGADGLDGADPAPDVPGVVRTPSAAGERVARFKKVPLVWCSADVAAATMDLMDYRAHLFTDAATETDAVVYRAGPFGYRLLRLRPADAPSGTSTGTGVAIAVDPHPAPVLRLADAVAHLDATGLGHLFFADRGTGRGRLLYRRFDHRYGLIADAA